MSLETLEARDRAATTARLRTAVADLRYAAQPTRCEVFTSCGPDARQLADDFGLPYGDVLIAARHHRTGAHTAWTRPALARIRDQLGGSYIDQAVFLQRLVSAVRRG